MEKEKLIELGVPEDIVDKVLSQHTEAIEAITKERDTAVTKVGTLEEQLKGANDTISAFGDTKPEDVKKAIADWEEKYNTDTEALKNQLTEQETNFQTEKFFSGYKFTSDLAKSAAMSAFREKGFKLEESKFLGGEDFMAELLKSNPSAFETDGDKPPKIMTETSGDTQSSGGVEAAFLAKNPNLKID